MITDSAEALKKYSGKRFSFFHFLQVFCCSSLLHESEKKYSLGCIIYRIKKYFYV